MKFDINFDLDFTVTVIAGLMIILTGLVSLFILKDVNFATTCIVTGAGLCGIAKVANTAYDNAHKE